MSIYVRIEKVNWGNKNTSDVEELDTVTAVVTTTGVVEDTDYQLAEEEPTINSIKVEGNFVEREDVFEPFIPETTKAEYARRRRNELLQETDWIVNVSDHPQHSAYIAYRTALRNWPSTADFPATRPVLGE
tara:strand:- start:663 stop:1055 length:393 start_codon:yes stop_codon:yes gene_type:complete